MVTYRQMPDEALLAFAAKIVREAYRHMTEMEGWERRYAGVEPEDGPVVNWGPIYPGEGPTSAEIVWMVSGKPVRRMRVVGFEVGFFNHRPYIDLDDAAWGATRI